MADGPSDAMAAKDQVALMNIRVLPSCEHDGGLATVYQAFRGNHCEFSLVRVGVWWDASSRPCVFKKYYDIFLCIGYFNMIYSITDAKPMIRRSCGSNVFPVIPATMGLAGRL